jgi:rRNA maturation protein Nop10
VGKDCFVQFAAFVGRAGGKNLEFLFVIRNANESAENFSFASWTMPSIPRWRGVDPDDCPSCGGTGYIAKPVDLNGKSDGVAFIRSKCPVCGGTGRKRSIPPSTAG